MENLRCELLNRIDSIMTENLELKLENINFRVQLKQNPVRPVVYQSSFLTSEYANLVDRVDNLEKYNCLIDSLSYENEELHEKLEILKERLGSLKDRICKLEHQIHETKIESTDKPENPKPEEPKKPEKSRKVVKTAGSIQDDEKKSISDIAKLFL